MENINIGGQNDETTLNQLISSCRKYIENVNYVYKVLSCEWLVVMRKLDQMTDGCCTETNEGRKNVVDIDHAKFRGDGFMVIRIINLNNPHVTTEQQINISYGKKTLYKVGTVVRPDRYDRDIDMVCSGGIHYFKTLMTAYYYRHPPARYTGKWMTWHDNGEKAYVGRLDGGKEIGRWIGWSSDGLKKYEGVYYEGLRSGVWREWHANGQKKSECDYIDGQPFGIYIAWFSDGKKSSEGSYNDGLKTGTWHEWYESGNKKSESDYIGGVQTGRRVVWNDGDGRKILEYYYDIAQTNLSDIFNLKYE
jgi:hypothetical protein